MTHAVVFYKLPGKRWKRADLYLPKFFAFCASLRKRGAELRWN